MVKARCGRFHLSWLFIILGSLFVSMTAMSAEINLPSGKLVGVGISGAYHCGGQHAGDLAVSAHFGLDEYFLAFLTTLDAGYHFSNQAATLTIGGEALVQGFPYGNTSGLGLGLGLVQHFGSPYRIGVSPGLTVYVPLCNPDWGKHRAKLNVVVGGEFYLQEAEREQVFFVRLRLLYSFTTRFSK